MPYIAFGYNSTSLVNIPLKLQMVVKNNQNVKNVLGGCKSVNSEFVRYFCVTEWFVMYLCVIYLGHKDT